MAKTTGRATGRPKSAPLRILAPSGQPIPAIPVNLGEEGKRFWREVFAHAHWLDPELDGYLVEQAALIADDLETARATLRINGRYVVNPNGSQQRSPAATDHERLIVLQNALMASLGLTPSDRSRLGLVATDHEQPLRELERRRALREITQTKKETNK